MFKIALVPLLFIALIACSQNNDSKEKSVTLIESNDSLQTAYFAAGCFWCVEAIFESINGVDQVISGYSGGLETNPTYETVSRGNSRHAETVKIVYDSTIISYDTLLMAFFGSHDPSTLNSQGPDFGPQYRSIIFYQNSAEKEQAQKYIRKLIIDKTFPKITTEVVPLTKFYPAEIYHQDYEKNNPENSYVQRVSTPRLNAFKNKFGELLKKE